MALEREIETYKNKLPELAGEEGKYVLIHKDEVVDTFGTYEDAIKVRIRAFQALPVFGQADPFPRTDSVHFAACSVPYFTCQVAPHGGLILTAVIGVSRSRQEALVAAEQPVPNGVTVEALVDTGASSTCVDPSVLDQLSLSPTGQIQINIHPLGRRPFPRINFCVSIRYNLNYALPRGPEEG